MEVLVVKTSHKHEAITINYATFSRSRKMDSFQVQFKLTVLCVPNENRFQQFVAPAFFLHHICIF